MLFLFQKLRSVWQLFLPGIRGLNPAQCMNYFRVMYIKSPLPCPVTWYNESYHSHEINCCKPCQYCTSIPQECVWHQNYWETILTHICTQSKQHCNIYNYATLYKISITNAVSENPHQISHFHNYYLKLYYHRTKSIYSISESMS